MDRESFLTAIADEPDPDASRRVYADWLDDHGDPDQAEFIRLQLRLAAVDEFDESRAALAERERELLVERGADWARVLIDHGALGWTFRRGTLCWATFALSDFLRHGQTVLERTPVRRFDLTDARPGLADLAASPLLGRVRRLRLTSNEDDDADPGLDDTDLAILAGSAHLDRLEALHLPGHAFGAAGLAALLGATSLDRLEKLDLGSCRLGDDGIALLAASPALARLRVLNLHYAQFGRGALQALGASSYLRELRDLDLSGGPEREEVLADPVAADAFPRLTRLNLGRRRLTEEFVRTLTHARWADNLEWLRCGEVSPSAFAALLRLPRVRAAVRLRVHLTHRSIDRHGIQPCRAPFPGGDFCLEANHEAGAEFAAVLNAADLPQLRWLGLHAFGGTGTIHHLADSPNVGRLSVLDLRGTPLADDDVRSLADCPRLKGLKRLAVADAAGEALDLVPLAASRGFGDLESLSVGSKASGASLRALDASPLAPACQNLPALRARFDWPEEWWSYRDDLARGRLSLWNLHPGEEAIRRLAEVPALAQIRDLDVGGTDLTLPGLRALLASPYLKNLRLLRLSFNDDLGDEGAELVANSPHLAGLLSLKMSFCSVGDAGMKALATSPFVTNLRVLKLWDCRVADEGASALARSPNFRRLIGLRLTGNAIGDAGAVALADSPFLNDLLYLSVSGNSFGPAGETALRQRFGHRLRIFTDDPHAAGVW
jgi:uncharacterized protein (TIGR02996 family)